MTTLPLLSMMRSSSGRGLLFASSSRSSSSSLRYYFLRRSGGDRRFAASDVLLDDERWRRRRQKTSFFTSSSSSFADNDDRQKDDDMPPRTFVMDPAGSTSWEELDARVNTYPMERKFQAIGVNSDAFVEDVKTMIEETLRRKVHPENVTSNVSKNGKYRSCNVNVVLQSGDEVVKVMQKLKKDERIKWYL